MESEQGSSKTTDCLSSYSHSHFTLEPTIALSVVSACVFPVLLVALRAISFSSKLPSPFKSLCVCVLLLDAVLAVETAIEPWLMHYAYYNHDTGDLGVLLVNTVTTLLTLERVSALKFPLKYIACSSNFKLTVCATATLLALETTIYALSRILPCYALQYVPDCDIYHINYIFGLQMMLCMIATVCFVLVVLHMMQTKRRHIRRITRMGLPLTYARNATAAHVSATLFGIFPTMLFSTLFSILSVYRCRLSNPAFLVWCSILSRIVLFIAHGSIFNIWFDEGRLHFLTLLSPLRSSIKSRADQMRIQVYNIVIARTFDKSSAEGQHRSRNSASSSGGGNKFSVVSASSRIGRARRFNHSDKFNDIGNIAEAATAV